MNPKLFRLDHTLERDPAIEAWLNHHDDELHALARHWFHIMRTAGDEVRELLHDGCPHACLGDVPFACVNLFTAHANVGFFQGATLPDPAHLLQGSGKRMRHVKLTPAAPADKTALTTLIHTAYPDIKSRIEHG